MSKPILWLGPLEELDADYDPLLGRSATQTPLMTVVAASKARLDPSRSVFDDPISEPTSAASTPILIPGEQTLVLPIAISPEQPNSEPEMALEGADPLVEDDQIVADTTSSPLWSEIEVPHHVDETALEAPQPTDFTHNNDPIPARQDTGPLETGPAPSNFAFGSDTVDAPVPVKKSFFANLFSKREIAPAIAAGGASINEIWAKSEPEPEPEAKTEPMPEAEPGLEAELVSEPELKLDAVPETIAELEPIAETPVTLAVEPIAAPAAKVVNIWANIDKEPDAIASVDEHDADTSPQALEGDIAPKDIANQDQAEPTPVRETDDEAGELAQNVTDAAPENQADIAIEIDDDAQKVPELASSERAPTPDELPRPSFRNAFNADNFWALPPAQKPTVPDVQEQTAREAETVTGAFEVTEAIDTQAVAETASGEPSTIAAAAAPIQQQKPQAQRTKSTGKRRKKKVKKDYIGAFCGTFLFGVTALMTAVSTAAPFGYPFDMVSSYRWYWVILAVVAAGIWGLSRGWKMVMASFAVMGVNLFVTVPASGQAPTGGNTATQVIGWANVAGNSDALARVFKDADKKRATLLMLAETPQSVLTPPPGWTLIEAPLAGDPTAIAVLSKSGWRAATVPGEPTMARPPAGEMTIIGVHPQDAKKGRRRTPMRDALINRAGTRAGIQEGPTVVVGDFNAAPWDQAMGQFRDYGNVTRVRCGGWAGSTFTQAFGLIGIATDHAFVRDVKVTHCQLGGSLTGGNHKPMWLYVAPQPPSAQPQTLQP